MVAPPLDSGQFQIRARWTSDRSALGASVEYRFGWNDLRDGGSVAGLAEAIAPSCVVCGGSSELAIRAFERPRRWVLIIVPCLARV